MTGLGCPKCPHDGHDGHPCRAQRMTRFHSGMTTHACACDRRGPEFWASFREEVSRLAQIRRKALDAPLAAFLSPQ